MTPELEEKRSRYMTPELEENLNRRGALYGIRHCDLLLVFVSEKTCFRDLFILGRDSSPIHQTIIFGGIIN